MHREKNDTSVKLYEINQSVGYELRITVDDTLIDSSVTLSGDNEVMLAGDGMKIEGAILGFEDGKVLVRWEGEMRFKSGVFKRIPPGQAIVGARRLIGFASRGDWRAGYVQGWEHNWTSNDITRGHIDSAIRSSVNARGTVLAGGESNREGEDVKADILVRLPS